MRLNAGVPGITDHARLYQLGGNEAGEGCPQLRVGQVLAGYLGIGFGALGPAAVACTCSRSSVRLPSLKRAAASGGCGRGLPAAKLRRRRGQAGVFPPGFSSASSWPLLTWSPLAHEHPAATVPRHRKAQAGGVFGLNRAAVGLVARAGERAHGFDPHGPPGRGPAGCAAAFSSAGLEQAITPGSNNRDSR